MKIFHTIADIRAQIRLAQCASKSVALVPTMGSLHAGHLQLVSRAKEIADVCVVTIFINPTQFGEGEDFDSYPRDLGKDLNVLEELCPDALVFVPSIEEMYAGGATRTWVNNDEMAKYLCGASRPGHFQGVLTVVSKLFNACPTDIAVFGLKDVQQFFLIKKMVVDLNINISIEGVPTVREEDGLALSSRNRKLSPEERDQAPFLSRAIFAARTAIEEGVRDGGQIEARMAQELAAATHGKIDYAQVVLTTDLAPVDTIRSGDIIIAAVAVFFSNARLIDNVIIVVP